MDRYQRYNAYLKAWGTGRVDDGIDARCVAAAALGAHHHRRDDHALCLGEFDDLLSGMGAQPLEDRRNDEPGDIRLTDRDEREKAEASARLQGLILAGEQTDTGGRWLFDAAADEIVRLREHIAVLGKEEAHSDKLVSKLKTELRQAKEALEQARAKVDELRRDIAYGAERMAAERERGAAEMRERAAVLLRRMKNGIKDVLARAALQDGADAIRALPLDGAPPAAPWLTEDERAALRQRGYVERAGTWQHLWVGPAYDPAKPDDLAELRRDIAEHRELDKAESDADLTARLKDPRSPLAKCIEPRPVDTDLRDLDKAELSAEDAETLHASGAWRTSEDGLVWIGPAGGVVDPRTSFGLRGMREAAQALRAKAPPGAHGEPGKATGGDLATGGTSSLTEEQGAAQGVLPVTWTQNPSAKVCGCPGSYTPNPNQAVMVCKACDGWRPAVAGDSQGTSPAPGQDAAPHGGDRGQGLHVAELVDLVSALRKRVTSYDGGDRAPSPPARLLRELREAEQALAVARAPASVSPAATTKPARVEVGQRWKHSHDPHTWTVGEVDRHNDDMLATLHTDTGRVVRVVESWLTKGPHWTFLGGPSPQDPSPKRDDEPVARARSLRPDATWAAEVAKAGAESPARGVVEQAEKEHQCGGPREACMEPGCDECGTPAEMRPASDIAREMVEARSEGETFWLGDRKESIVLSHRFSDMSQGVDCVRRIVARFIERGRAEGLRAACRGPAAPPVHLVEPASGGTSHPEALTSADGRVTLIIRDGVEARDVAAACIELLGLPVPPEETQEQIEARAYNHGFREGERRAKAKAVELQDRWNATRARAAESGNVVKANATLACILHIRAAFGITDAPTDPGKPPTGEPVPDATGVVPEGGTTDLAHGGVTVTAPDGMTLGEVWAALTSLPAFRVCLDSELRAARESARGTSPADLETARRDIRSAVLEDAFRAGSESARLATPRLFPVTPGPLAELAGRIEGVMVQAFAEPGDGERRGPAAARRVLRLMDEHLRGAAGDTSSPCGDPDCSPCNACCARLDLGADTADAPAQGPTLEALRELVDRIEAEAKSDFALGRSRGSERYTGRAEGLRLAAEHLQETLGIEPPPCPPPTPADPPRPDDRHVAGEPGARVTWEGHGRRWTGTATGACTGDGYAIVDPDDRAGWGSRRVLLSHVHRIADPHGTAEQAVSPTREELLKLVSALDEAATKLEANAKSHTPVSEFRWADGGQARGFAVAANELRGLLGLPMRQSPTLLGDMGPQGTPGPVTQDGSAGDQMPADDRSPVEREADAKMRAWMAKLSSMAAKASSLAFVDPSASTEGMGPVKPPHNAEQGALAEAIHFCNLVASEGKRVEEMIQGVDLGTGPAETDATVIARKPDSALVPLATFQGPKAMALAEAWATANPGAWSSIVALGNAAAVDGPAPAAVTPPPQGPHIELRDGAEITVGSYDTNACEAEGPAHGGICTAHIDGWHVCEDSPVGDEGRGSWHVLERWPIEPTSPETCATCGGSGEVNAMDYTGNTQPCDACEPASPAECGAVDEVFGPGLGPVCTRSPHSDGMHQAVDHVTGRHVSSWVDLPETPDPRWEPGAVWEHRGAVVRRLELRVYVRGIAHLRVQGTWSAMQSVPCADMNEVNGWRYVGKK
jgi:hypothetical protein